jgi:hypothetical protein
MPRLVTPEGQIVDVPEEHVEAALRQKYQRVTGADLLQASDERIRQARVDSRGPLDQAGAAALGFASGLTFGASNVVADSLDLADRETQQNLRTDYPVTSTVSEIAGAVAPALIPGGQGSLVRALPAAKAAATSARIARTAEGAGALSTIGRQAAAGAFEGAAQAAGQYLSDAALEDRELSAEALIAEAGTGALFGGGVSGGLSAAERGFVAARKLVPKSAATDAKVKSAADAVDATVQKALASSEATRRAALEQLDLMRLKKAELEVAAKARVAEKRALDVERARVQLARAQGAPLPPSSQAAPDALPTTTPAGSVADDAAPAPLAEPSAAPDALPAAASLEPVGALPVPEPIAAVGSAPIAREKAIVEIVDTTAPPPAPYPNADDSLSALLAQTSARLDAGESFADLTAQAARRPSKPRGKSAAVEIVPDPPARTIDPIYEAMAELDAEAAEIVEKIKALDAGTAKIERRFSVRGRDGTRKVTISEMGSLTLGRVKQAYLKASDAEKAAILEAIGPEKSAALIDVIEGRAKFDTRFKSKTRLAEEEAQRALMREGTGPSPDEIFPDDTPMIGPAHVPEIEVGDVEDLHRTMADLREFETSLADLVDVAGPRVPQGARELAAAQDAARSAAADQQAALIAQMADDMPTSAPAMPDPEAPTLPASPPVRTRLDELREQKAELDVAGKAEANERLVLDKAIAQQKLSTQAALDEIKLQRAREKAASERKPAGPISKVYAKFASVLAGSGKIGFGVPLVGGARLAAGVASVMNKVSGSVDTLLAAGERVAGSKAARKVGTAASWRAYDVLKERIYDDGTERKRAENVADAMRHRLDELQAAAANPAGVRATVRAALRDADDPLLIDATVSAAQRKLAYLAKHAPQPPEPDLLSRSVWKPSPTDVERFARRVRAANDPASVLEDVATGRVTAEGAETLREVYPRLYAEARMRLVERASEVREQLPHALVVRLSVLFDAPLVRSLQPEHMAAIQSASAVQAPQQQPQTGGMASPPAAGAPNVSDLFMTADQRRAR